MPNTCIHLEKIKEMFDSCFADRVSSNEFKIGYDKRQLPPGNVFIYDSSIWVKASFGSFFKEIKETAERCNCENVEDLKRRIRELESNSSNQLVLKRNTETERNDLQVAKRNLESRNYDLERERNSLQSSNWSLQSANSSLQTERDGLKEQVREKNDLIRSGEVVLRTTQNQLTTVQNQLTTKNTEYSDLNLRFNALQIESNNKNNEINSLKEELKSSQNVDLRYKERKRDELVRNFGLNRARVINLSDAYERLIRAREDYNRDNIANANSEIEVIKAELFQTNVNINDLHKLYKTCEKVAELKVKQERLHEQQYQAQQEVPTNN